MQLICVIDVIECEQHFFKSAVKRGQWGQAPTYVIEWTNVPRD